MATRIFELLGLRAALFASGNRAGLELSAPISGLRRRMGASAANGSGSPPSHTAASINETALSRRVAAIDWYHTLDLGDGVITPGFYDHHDILDRYGLPPRLDGMRVLDIACFDGFWSFEFERRGASEVVALDIASACELDLPWRLRSSMSAAELERPFGRGFELASQALGSKVKHVHCNVYDLTPEKFGLFDLVHCGDLLLHLRDPARALYNMYRVTRGSALISDCIYPDMDRHDGEPIIQYDGGLKENIWWRFGANALSAMIRDAGFNEVDQTALFRYGPRGQPATMWHAVYSASPHVAHLP